MSFSVPFMWDAVEVPSTRVPISTSAFVSHVVPPVVFYIVLAMLAVTPKTRTVRIMLWPIAALLAFRATVSLDMTRGNPDLVFFNVHLMFFMLAIAARTLSWTLAEKALVRHSRPKNSSVPTILDALDLVTNIRGIGWDWSRGLYIPHETRPAKRIPFALYTLLSGVANTLISGFLHQAIKSFVSSARINSRGPSIFDETLPFFVRYLRASIITILGGIMTHTGMQMCYDITTLPFILVFGQDPAQWPPAFDNPWVATSLCDFWARRWHQFYREIFLLGGYPLQAVFGRAGGIIGTFLASGLCHHLMMMMLGNRSDDWRMFFSFGMMGPGVLAERAFRKITGKKVGGIAGWVWTMSWLLVLGSVMIEGFSRGGLFVPPSAIHGLTPLRLFIENLVVGFDAWLHTL